MNILRKSAAIAAASAALGFAALSASPAAAQVWYGDGYGPRGYEQAYGYGYGPGPYGYGGWDTDAGETDIAICPPTYHLGPNARLCWPD